MRDLALKRAFAKPSSTLRSTDEKLAVVVLTHKPYPDWLYPSRKASQGTDANVACYRPKLEN